MKTFAIVLQACLAAMLFGNGHPLLAQSPLNLVWTSAPGDERFGYAAPGQTSINHKLGLRGSFDFDGDGLGEFVTTLQSNDDPAARDNNVYLFEADGDNSYALRWSYQFTNLTGRGNGVAVGDLDNDGNPEIICLVQKETALDNLYVFEIDPATKIFPDTATATWNTPRAEDGRFRPEVDINVTDIDHDGRQEIILNAFDGLVIASLLSPDLSQPTFVAEYENFIELQWVLAMTIADLDNNGANELVTFGGWGLGADYYFNVVEAFAPDLYSVATSLNDTQVPGQFGCYSAMLAADFDGNSFPEIYYADTNGNLRSIVLDGDYLSIPPEKFHLLGSVGSEVLTMTAIDTTFYLATSTQHTVYTFNHLGGVVTDSASFKLDSIFTVPGVGNNIVFKFIGGTDMDGDQLPDYVLATAGHDSTLPTLYVLEASAPTGVGTRLAQIPAGYELAQNFPNPFNPTTTIRYTVPIAEMVAIRIYDVLGRKVATLIDAPHTAGRYEVLWTSVDDRGVPVASGLYVYEMCAGTMVLRRTMQLVK